MSDDDAKASYRVSWIDHENGLSGHGSPIGYKNALEWAKQGNIDYPHIVHRVERVETIDTNTQSEPAPEGSDLTIEYNQLLFNQQAIKKTVEAFKRDQEKGLVDCIYCALLVDSLSEYV